jgi:thiosulfate dehydrogenase [quinone] large subunit
MAAPAAPNAGRVPRSVALDNVTHSEHDIDRALGCLLLRMILGLNIALHGTVRIFIGSLDAFVGNTVKQFEKTILPVWQVQAFATVIPVAELVIGVMLLLGLAKRWTLIAGMLLMAALVFGTALRSDWTLLELQMFYVLLYFVLFLCQRWDAYSVRTLLGRRG